MLQAAPVCQEILGHDDIQHERRQKLLELSFLDRNGPQLSASDTFMLL